MNPPLTTRRRFLATAGAATAATLTATQHARAAGANDRIRIGLIGCGGRGFGAHLPGIHNNLEALDHEVVAICDPWRIHRERAVADVKKRYGREPKACTSFRELLELDHVDAVMIASPDHWHTVHLEAAAKAGKHAYVEKPMAIDMADLLKATDAVKEAGVVVQAGTQLRSMPGIAGARKLYQTGILGDISRIEECRNSVKPFWYHYLKDNVKKEDVDWEEFTMGRTKRPFSAHVYSGWYGYYEFSQGPVPQWGTHFFDMIHYVTGAGIPESCMCHGGCFHPKDEYDFTAPDHVQATWIYKEGFMLSYSTNLSNGSANSRKILGDKGVMDISNWNAPTISAEGAPHRDGSIRGTVKVEPVEGPDHFLDWLQCMRDGGTPRASIDAGYQHSVTSLMAVMSYETGRRITYDPATRKLVPA